MVEETVDVVDEHDRVVAAVKRSEIRSQNLRHRAVYILVFNRAGQLFVHQRSRSKDVFPGFWDTAIGGVLSSGESYDEAAHRELAEELGVKGVSLRRLFPFRFEDSATRIAGMVYSCSHDGPFLLQAAEIDCGMWEDLDRVIERAQHDSFCPDSLEALLLYLDKLATARSG